MKNAIRVGVATIAVFFGGLGTWSVLAPLDGAVVGGGTLQVHGRSKTVQHRDGGIVSALLVGEGQQVASGQVLMRLDDTQAQALLHVHEAQLAGDRAMSARDLAEIAGAATIAYPPALDPASPVAAAVMGRERLVFANHRDLLAREGDVLDERIRQARQQQDGAQLQLDSTRRQSALGDQELQSLTTLERDYLAPHNRVLELHRGVEQLRGEIGQLQSDVARFGAEQAELQAEKLRLRENAVAEATHELRDAQLRINDVLPRLAADRDVLARLTIRAPIAGAVTNLAMFTTGGVIEPGKPILDIVPQNQAVVAEADIRPEDIEYLRVGAHAQIIATGFNARETPPIAGAITVISADRITDPRTGRSFFRAEIALTDDREHGRLLRQLGPGMPIEVIVPVKPRTAFDYLMEPLRGSMRSALHEM